MPEIPPTDAKLGHGPVGMHLERLHAKADTRRQVNVYEADQYRGHWPWKEQLTVNSRTGVKQYVSIGDVSAARKIRDGILILNKED